MEKGFYKKPIILGFGASLLLLGFYFLFLSLANSFSHAAGQFSQLWYWILILILGFGLQVGLFVFIREKQKIVSGKTLAASGGISTGAMIACCLHHLTDVLPLMGLAAAAVFLTRYQLFFIIVGILSNLVGIAIMLEIIKRNQLVSNLKKATIALSLILLPISFLLVGSSEKEINSAITLPSKINTQGGVSFEVTPKSLNFNKPLEFEIKIDTHSGSLDFDLTRISLLEDDLGNSYLPLEWQGAEPGGHHRSGILIFPKLEDNKIKKLKLTIQDVQPRIFEWEIYK